MDFPYLCDLFWCSCNPGRPLRPRSKNHITPISYPIGLINIKTAYHREPPFVRLVRTPESKDGIMLEQKEITIEEEQRTHSPIPQKRMSWVRSLRIYTGVYSRAPFWKIATRPFILFFYPAVLWAFLSKYLLPCNSAC